LYISVESLLLEKAITGGGYYQGRLLPGEAITRGGYYQGRLLPGEAITRGGYYQGRLLPGEAITRGGYYQGRLLRLSGVEARKRKMTGALINQSINQYREINLYKIVLTILYFYDTNFKV
jgi:hypothetical protein